LQKIGTMAYKLELPSSSRVHLVFRVSCLKKVINDKLPIQTVFPELDEEGNIILDPEAFMETRTRQLWNQKISEYLIKWKIYPLKTLHGRMRILYRNIQNYSFLKERGMLGPYNIGVASLLLLLV